MPFYKLIGVKRLIGCSQESTQPGRKSTPHYSEEPKIYSEVLIELLRMI